MDLLEKNFCKAFGEWEEKSPRGSLTRLAKKLDKTQGYLSNIKSGERSGSETLRREIAKEIGIKYEVMIGLEDSNLNIIEFESKVEREHYHIIRKFENKEVAKNLNQDLVVIEKHNVLEFGMLVGTIKKTAEKYEIEENKEVGGA